MSYPHLLSELRIGGVTLRNRVAQSAHAKCFGRDGADSQRDLDYLVERARGGTALLIVGNRLVHPGSIGLPRVAAAFLREGIAGDRRLTDAVHDHGAVLFAQLNHFGVNAASDSPEGYGVLWAPSAVRSPALGETAKEMEPEDIAEAVEWWGRSAECARDGGFDGVEVHVAHSYLLHEFLSPVYNRRDDAYGGSLENRLRLTREVIAEVRRRVGDDFVVGIRLVMDELLPGGLTIEDTTGVAALLEADGRIDYVNTTVAGYHNMFRAVASSDQGDGYLVELAARIKAATSGIPVFAVGGIKHPALAEDVIASGKADVVAMIRAQIADPEWVAKAQAGREDEIVHCIRGNQGCIGRVARGLPVTCTVNPAAGRERRLGAGTLAAAAEPARWLVVGGGPAGMRAAVTLARRGHEVVLLECEPELGGQVNLILRTPGRDEFAWVTRDLQVQLDRAGVEVRLGVEATPEAVRALAPDAVLVATGARPDGTGHSMVAPFVERLPGGERALTLWDALLGTKPVGRRVVVLDDDGTRAAAGVCEALLDRGHEVELVSRHLMLFPDTLLHNDLAPVYGRVLGKGLAHRLHAWASAVEDGAVEVYDLFTGATERVTADTVVLATGRHAEDGLYRALKAELPRVHRAGDCVAPRTLDHAIYEGELAGRELWSAEERSIVEGELERWAEPVAV